jgi:hypothetical protein
MSEPKKMNTRGFFRNLIKFAITGDGENPIEHVIQKGLEEHGKAAKEVKGKKDPEVIETTGEEASQRGDSDNEGT